MKSDEKLPKMSASSRFSSRAKRALGRGERLRQALADAGAALVGDAAAHAARHRPGGVDLAAPEGLDDLLAELAKPDARPGEGGVGRDQPEDVSRRLRGVPAQDEVGRAQVEEAERMALDDLAQVHQPAQLVRGWGDRDGHDGVAGPRRGQQVAHGADPADARRDGRHLPVGAALAELLEAAELHHVELGVGHVPCVVQEDADLGVPLDAGHRVDYNALAHGKFLSAL
jgi:hypothetical protein